MPIISGGGGGGGSGTPFNGGTITNALTVNPAVQTGDGFELVIIADATARTGNGYAVTVQDEFGDQLGTLSAFGGIATRGDIWGDSAVFRVGAGRGFVAANAAGAAMIEAVDPGSIGFYGHAAVAQQTGVAVTVAAVHAALVALGLITA